MRGLSETLRRRYGGVPEPWWWGVVERLTYLGWVWLWSLPMSPADFLWLKAVGDWIVEHRSWTPPHDLLSPFTHTGPVPNLSLYTAVLVSLWSRVFPGVEGLGWLHAVLVGITGGVWRLLLGRWAWFLWPLYNGFFHARPQVFTGMLFLPFLVLREARRGWRRTLGLLGMLTLWLPLHGGGALVALALLGMGGVLRRRWEDVAVAVLVPWLHPWGGWTFLQGLVDFLDRPLRYMIVEWQPPWFFLVETTNTALLGIGGGTFLVGLWSLTRMGRWADRGEVLALSLATWSAIRYMIFLGPYVVWKLRPPLAWWLLAPYLLLAPLGYVRMVLGLETSSYPPPGPRTGVVVGYSPAVDVYLFRHAPRLKAAVYANWDRFSAVHLTLYRRLLGGTHCAYWRVRARHAVVREGKPEEACFAGWVLRKAVPGWKWYENPGFRGTGGSGPDGRGWE